MYGQTEPPRISLLDDKFKQFKFNSIGKPLSGGKLVYLMKMIKRLQNHLLKVNLFIMVKMFH